MLLVLLLTTSSGCSLLRSRYAMDDSVYAAKYAVGASKRNLAGKIKQALDARHTEHLDGWLVSGGAQVQPRSGETFGSFEVGRELYDSNYFTTRLALSGFAGGGAGSLGLDAGARLQTPTRLAPFVGVGGSAGLLLQDAVPLLVEAAFESDNQIESFTQSESDSVGGIAAVYPEVGMHFWLDGRIRLTAFGRYLVTSEGREFDDWMVGGQIAIFSR